MTTPHPDAPPFSPPPPPPPPPTDRDTALDRRSSNRRTTLPVIAASVLSAVLASGFTAAAVDGETAPAASAVSAQPAALEPTPTSDPGDERVANAAAAVAPAVVQIQTGTGVGSGVVYDESGLVLTVAHVVGESRSVEVRLADGTTVDGEVVGTHPETDVAVVRIAPEHVDVVAELATDADLVVGQLAVAVGSPFGLDQTVTSGIVSAVDRVVNDVTMVQTDAAINPGNSGGPLVDAAGRVIGLSDLIFSKSGGNEGVGFATQIDLARIVADQLVAGRPVRLALLGVSTTPAAGGARGAQVAEVAPGSAAADAGIEVGDLVVAVEGVDIADSNELRATVIRRAPGSEVTVGLERDGEPMDVDVVLGATG